MICIIIPTYNEKENIFKLIEEITKLIENVNIVVVDDSVDKLDALKKIDNVSYIHRGSKLGRGSAVLEGIKEGLLKEKNKIFIEMDADFSHDPKELKKNIDYFKKENLNFLIASRYVEGSKIINWPLSRHLLSKFSNFLAKFLLRVPINDYTNGFRFYDKNAAKHVIKKCEYSKSTGFILLSEIVLELYKNNYKISEISTIFVNRVRGESKVNFNEILNSFIGLLKLYLSTKINKK